MEYDKASYSVGSLSHHQFYCFLSTDGENQLALAKDGDQLIALTRHNAEYSCICFKSCKQDFMSVVKDMGAKGFTVQGIIGIDDLEREFGGTLLITSVE